MSKFTDSCAPTNALQNLSNAYGQSNSKIQTGVERQIDQLLPGGSAGDVLAQEFLAQKARQIQAPNTFNMRSLIARRGPEQSTKWADEFYNRQPKNAPPDQWASEFAQQRFNMNSMARELPSSQWADEFASRHQQETLADNRAPRAAEEWANDFDSWLSGKPHLQGNAATLDSAWTDAQGSQNDAPLGDQWASEFAQKMMGDNMSDDLLEQEFDSLFQSSLNRLGNYSPLDELAGEYEFAQNNPHITEENLMEHANEHLNSGNTQEAILYYEAAVQRNPQDANAWCQLGLSHAENEHDIAAISAYRKALEIDPEMKDALLAYSVSLANESYDNESLIQLERWVNVYKKGAWKLAEQATRPTDLLHQSYIDPIRFEKVERQFLDAARAQTNVDPELQNALGVLYNLNRNFDRAVDSIKAAIARSPENPRLWNRLGATLANSDRTAEAIEAYRHALTLFPSYVRARYNLGISCMHLSCYREAAEHFLSALRLQKAADNSPIWSTLRSAIIRMNATDSNLMNALNNRDLGAMQQALSGLQTTA
ncbi:hypothetical protein M3Y97_00510000 [Aphelenchoides bicaudatus]|nr:hypothetical protein M3Y97_00510000 [Aphelenchoides bicaudatus]